MLTDEKLVEIGFYKYKVDDVVHFRNGWIKLQKTFCGYLVEQPNKIISTLDELNELIK